MKDIYENAVDLDDVKDMAQGKIEYTPPPVVATPATLLQMAVESGADVEKLEKLMDLQERWEANQAAKEFNVSMAAAQSEMPEIFEDKTNTQTRSTYSSYKGILKAIKPIYTKNGFSMLFYEDDTDGEDIRVCADVMHSGGHTRKVHVDIPLDMTGIKGTVNKTKPHAKASSISYGRNYIIRMVWNLATSEDDGNAAGQSVELITDEQLLALEAKISDNYEKPGAEQLKKWIFSTLKIQHLNEIRADRYDWLIGEIDKAIASRSKA